MTQSPSAVNPETEARFQSILNNELMLALGCTEPIAIAYAAAKAKALLGVMPERIRVGCSGNIIKNVKAVIVPGSGNMKGVDTAAILGTIGGDEELKLEVLSKITSAHVEEAKALLKTDYCKVELIENVPNLLIVVEAFYKDEHVLVEIRDAHTHIARMEKNGKVVFRDISCAEDMKTEESAHPVTIFLAVSSDKSRER